MLADGPIHSVADLMAGLIATIPPLEDYAVELD